MPRKSILGELFGTDSWFDKEAQENIYPQAADLSQ